MEAKEYDVTAAIAAMLLSPATASREEMCAMLVAGSDIPADRLDFALSELTEGLDAMRGLIAVQEIALGRKATIAEIQAMVSGATWIDDDKGEATYTTAFADESGEEMATVTVKTKMKRAAND